MKKTYLMFFIVVSGLTLLNGGAMADDQIAAQTDDDREPTTQAPQGTKNETSPPAPSDDARSGALEVVSNPAGARVFVTDDESYPAEEIGDTPLREQSSPGTYWVNVSLEDYEDVTVKVDVNPGEKTIVTVDLAPVESSYRTKRVAGHALLWSGMAAVVTGVVLIEIEPQGNLGATGFLTAGVGVAATIAGGILLGLSHRDALVYEQPPVALAPLPDFSGGAVLFTKPF